MGLMLWASWLLCAAVFGEAVALTRDKHFEVMLQRSAPSRSVGDFPKELNFSLASSVGASARKEKGPMGKCTGNSSLSLSCDPPCGVGQVCDCQSCVDYGIHKDAPISPYSLLKSRTLAAGSSSSSNTWVWMLVGLSIFFACIIAGLLVFMCRREKKELVDDGPMSYFDYPIARDPIVIQEDSSMMGERVVGGDEYGVKFI